MEPCLTPWKARHIHVWLAIAAWLAVICCSSLAMANPLASPGYQVPDCQLIVRGHQAGSLIAASMRCAGQAPANVAFDNTMLGKFQANLPRVSATSSCKPKAKCLVTICSGALVLRGSSVSWVRSGFLETLVCVVGSGNLEVYNSHFLHNTVRPLGCFEQLRLLLHGSNISHSVVQGSGGGLQAEGGAVVMITAGSRVHNNTARLFGGGVFVLDNATVTLSDGSSVHNNTAHMAGGGVSAWDNATVTLSDGSSVGNNTAEFHGGGVAVRGNATVTLNSGSSVRDNIAQGYGGGVHALGNVNVSLSVGSSVHNNIADGDGGGVAAGGNANVTLSGGSSVHDTIAHKGGGGVHAVDSAAVTLSGGSSVHNNTAGIGGGVFAWGNASVTLSGGTSVHNNIARSSGGGVITWGNASVALIGDSSVHSNTAELQGGGVAAWDNATVTLIGGSSVRENTAQGYGGGVHALGNATVTLSVGSSVHNNIARKSGGGVAAWGNVNVSLSVGSSVHNNIADGDGGGVAAGDNANVTLIGGSSVHDNIAHKDGGGVYASNNANVTLCGGSSAHNNAGTSGGGVVVIMDANLIMNNQSHVHSNRALNGSGGGLLVSDMVVVTIGGNCSIVNNSCTQGVGGGIAVGVFQDTSIEFGVDSSIRFGDKGLRGNVESTGDVDKWWSTASVTISDSTIGNNTSYLSAGGGLAVASEATVRLTNGTRIIGNQAVNSSGGGAVLVDRATLHVDTDVSFVDNVVNRGYVGSTIAAFDSSNLSLPLRGDLTKCSTGVYLGRTPCEEGETLLNDVCMCCPRHTFSFGTSACQQCPPHGNCPGGSIVEPIAGYWHSSDRSTEMHRCPLFTAACNHTVMNATTVQTCNNGYQGSLCGACQLPEYGMVSPLKCDKCMHPPVQLGLYLLACFVTIVFIAFTVHATWRDNLKGGQAVRATDLIKVLVQFLQYVVIIGSVSIPWPPKLDLQRWFQAASTVFGAASGQALSLDCWLHRYMPHSALDLAIQRQLVYFLAPIGVLAGVVVLQYLIWAVRLWVVPLVWRQKATDVGRKQGANLVLRKLPVTVLVVTYYAYPTLLRASLSFFACLRIDTAHGPGPLNHPQGYWVSDIAQACFTGYLKGWALGLGLPSVLLWCIAVPVAMGVGLKLAGSKADADSFREHFGFLYRNYKPELMWWEAVWTARTVALTLVSVFSFPMGRYFSVICLLVVFLSSAALQTVFKPYDMSTLHNMHIISPSCLAATTIGAQAMFAYDITQESTAEVLCYVITVLVLFFNEVFVGWCGIRLAPAAKKACIRAYAKAKGWAEAVMGYAGKPGRVWPRGKARLHT